MLQGALAGLAASSICTTMVVSLTLMAQLVRVINVLRPPSACLVPSSLSPSSDGESRNGPRWCGHRLRSPAVELGSAELAMARRFPEATMSPLSAVTVSQPAAFLISMSFIMFGTKPKTSAPGPACVRRSKASWSAESPWRWSCWRLSPLPFRQKLVLTKGSGGVKLRAIADRPVATELWASRSSH